MKFSDEKFSSPMWKSLKDYMVKINRDAAKETHYLCQYCRPRSNELPCRCVLNSIVGEGAIMPQHTCCTCNLYAVMEWNAFTAQRGFACQAGGLNSL